MSNPDRGLPPGFRVVRTRRTSSTNFDLAALAREAEPSGVVLVADEQSAGRGRQGRSWLSFGESSLTFSVLRRPRVPAREAASWTLMAGLAAASSIAAQLPAGRPGPWLKWPNDVLVGPRKVAGILCELITQGSDVSAIVVGVGINITMPPGGWPEELADRAGSVESAAGAPRGGSGEQVLIDFLRELALLEREFVAWDLGPLMERVRDAMAPLFGQPVSVELDGERTTARVVGIEESGALVVEHEGARRRLLAGDVHLGAP